MAGATRPTCLKLSDKRDQSEMREAQQREIVGIGVDRRMRMDVVCLSMSFKNLAIELAIFV